MPHSDLLKHIVSHNVLDLARWFGIEVIILEVKTQSHPSGDSRIALSTIPLNSIEPMFDCYNLQPLGCINFLEAEWCIGLSG